MSMRPADAVAPAVALLLAAGYAPHYPETPLDSPRLDTLREGMERLIQGYEPYPALVVDAMYDVVAANRGVVMLMDGVAEHLLQPPLTAIGQPIDRLGRLGAERLIATITGDGAPVVETIRLPVCLVERGSVAAPREPGL